MTFSKNKKIKNEQKSPKKFGFFKKMKCYIWKPEMKNSENRLLLISIKNDIFKMSKNLKITQKYSNTKNLINSKNYLRKPEIKY